VLVESRMPEEIVAVTGPSVPANAALKAQLHVPP